MVEIVDVCNISSNYDFIVFKICVKSEQTKLTLKNIFVHFKIPTPNFSL